MGMGFPRKQGPFWPTLFCWSVMNYENPNEVATIKGQLRNRTGIFGCDNAAVLSGKIVHLGDGHRMPNGSYVQVHTWLNPAHSVPMGNLQGGDHTNSFKNADIFINAWDILTKSGAVFGHDWTAKVDPDAVFFAHRLRRHVKRFTPGHAPMWFKNCEFHGAKLYGALEVFNEAAMQAYKAKGAGCKNLPWAGWGEDEWIDTCMQQIGGQPQIDYKLVGDHRCMSAECYDIERVAFHDYKSEALYYDCWKKSTEAERIKDGGYFCCTYGQDKADPCNACQPTNQQWPGKSYCGGSNWSCHHCGPTTTWCRMVEKNRAELA
uniref:Uncharacterized protein n=1 Tax=Alexandrium monilatum TaxID=311494 RepID=A0A6T1JKN6_9DINO